jgi:hypothetical protein
LLPIDYSGEGRTDAILAERLIRAAGGTPGRNYVGGRRAHGKSVLDASLPGLLRAAEFGHRILVIRDLDGDAPCAGALVSDLAPRPPAGFCLRIAVRAAEAWLLADRERVAAALHVRPAAIPAEPEGLLDPKAELRALGAMARDREARRLLTGTPQQAQGWVADFLRAGWRPRQAAASAPSLARALRQVTALTQA